MNIQEFKNQINKLKNVFGEKNYADERVEQIWKWAKELQGNKFTAVVDSAISDCERAPLLPKLKEIANVSYSQKNKFECVYCNCEGWYVPKDSSPLPTVFACICEVGQSLPSYVKRFTGIPERCVPTAGELAWRNISTTIMENKK